MVTAAKPSGPDSPADALALFGVSGSVGAYGDRHVEYSYDQRGPGPRRPTSGPQDARAPKYWTVEAERIVLALVQSGHTVTSDDLRERFAAEPSATGAAVGALFKRLARRGLLELVEHRPSTRPEARGRVVGVWRAGPATRTPT